MKLHSERSASGPDNHKLNLVSDDQEQTPYEYKDPLSEQSSLALDDSANDLEHPLIDLAGTDQERLGTDFDGMDLDNSATDFDGMDLEHPLIDLVGMDQERLGTDFDGMDLDNPTTDLAEMDLENLAADLAEMDQETLAADLADQENLATDLAEMDQENLIAGLADQENLATDLADQENLADNLAEMDLENPLIDLNGISLGGLGNGFYDVDLGNLTTEVDGMGPDGQVMDFYEIDLERFTQDPLGVDSALAPTSTFPFEPSFFPTDLPASNLFDPTQDPDSAHSTVFRVASPVSPPSISGWSLTSALQRMTFINTKKRLIMSLLLVLFLALGANLLSPIVYYPTHQASQSVKPPKVVIAVHSVPTGSVDILVGAVPTATPTPAPTATPTPTPTATPFVQPTKAQSPPLPVVHIIPTPVPPPTPTPTPRPAPTPTSPPAIINYVANPTFQGSAGWNCSSNVSVYANTLHFITTSTAGGSCNQVVTNLQPNHTYIYKVNLKGGYPGIEVAGWYYTLQAVNLPNYQELSAHFSTGNASSMTIEIHGSAGQVETDAQNASVTLAP